MLTKVLFIYFYFLSIYFYLVIYLVIFVGDEDEIPQMRSFVRVKLIRHIARQVTVDRQTNFGNAL